MVAHRIDAKSLRPGSDLAAVLAESPCQGDGSVTIEYDGRRLTARAGEPVAVSLLAHGIHTLARSVKFHRPRGPVCLRGACDGCLTRIDGVPNRMACTVPAREGLRVESQNAFPNASTDLLRVTDWFFPRQFDHHHLMVKYGTALNRTMQVFARRMAGLGTLPDSDGALPPVDHVACDALVVGAGLAGLAAAATIARTGASVLAVDEEPCVGGALVDSFGASGSDRTPRARELVRVLERTAREAGVDLRTTASATATFDDATVVITPSRAVRVEPRMRLFATGRTEAVGVFDGNDLPGIYTARAAARALRHGVLVGERVVVVGSAARAEGLVGAMREVGATVEWFADGTAAVTRALGRSAVRAVEVRNGDELRSAKCDALVIADEPTPAYELIGQAGIAIDGDGEQRCFVPRVADDGSTERTDVFAAGSVRGRAHALGDLDLTRPLLSGGAVADGVRVAETLLRALRGGRTDVAVRMERRP